MVDNGGWVEVVVDGFVPSTPALGMAQVSR